MARSSANQNTPKSKPRYSDEEIKTFFCYTAVHGKSPKALQQMKEDLGLNVVPNKTTIERRIKKKPKEILDQWLEEAKASRSPNDPELQEWVRQIKGHVEDAGLSLQHYYECFATACTPTAEERLYPKGKTDKEGNSLHQKKLTAKIGSYLKFLHYLVSEYKGRIETLRDQLKRKPYHQKTREHFGNGLFLKESIVANVNTLIYEDMNHQEQLRLMEAFQNYVRSVSDLEEQGRHYLQSMQDAYERSGQISLLVEYATSLLSFTIWNEKAILGTVRLSDTVVQLINQMGLRHSHINEFLNIALTEGVFGRMGTHSLLALSQRENDKNPIAIFEIGDRYYDGFGGKGRDLQKAYEFYRDAANMNHAVAIWSCGYMLMNKPNDIQEKFSSDAERLQAARAYFERGAQMGSPACINSIGQLYLRGQTVDAKGRIEKRNLKKAEEYLLKSIDKGYFYSHNALGQVYELMAQEASQPAVRDKYLRQAFGQYEQAAKYSDGYSRNKIGQFWENGQAFEGENRCDRSNQKAAEIYKSVMKEVLEADRTPWNYVNAARVYAGKLIPCNEKPNIRKAVQYYERACSMLGPEHYGKILPDLLMCLLRSEATLNEDQAMSDEERTTLNTVEFLTYAHRVVLHVDLYLSYVADCEADSQQRTPPKSLLEQLSKRREDVSEAIRRVCVW